MKRILVIVLCVVLLVGCSSDHTLESATSLRETLLSSKGCSFHANITADYGDVLYSFGMRCTFDGTGNLTFTVTAPDTIAGISGVIRDNGGKLTFDDQLLAFELLADGQFSPVSAPWILVKALRSGYIHSSCAEKEGTYVCIDDSYEADALQVDIWLDTVNRPTAAEILWKNRRILSMQITDFTFL